MNKDQRLLEEAYQSICESLKEPLYFGPKKDKEGWLLWLKDYVHEVHEDGSVSIDGDVNFMVNTLSVFPFKFKKVTGDFSCFNLKLTTLEGAPEEVGGDFLCSYNMFKTLKGAPEKVGGSFYCFHNSKKLMIASLEGAPAEIGGEFESNRFTDEDYRRYAREKKIKKKLDKELDKDLNVDLGDFS
jgi:hypothetical protein